MIQLENVSKRYALSRKQQRELQTQAATVNAVSEVSFVCRPGSIYSLLGPNGAGKTSTLRMIATLLLPTSGSINVAGYDVVQQSEEVRRRIGFLT
jgi:sodium transport system ATP-binding protein